ncbi:MAG: hypothetical protein AAGJ35_03390, partial [Myxococcota bacterium]
MLFRYVYESMLEWVRAGSERSHLHQREYPAKLRADFRALLNHYGGIWRRLLLFALTSPLGWYSWRIFLEPGTVFWDLLAASQRRIAKQWEIGLLSTSILLGIIAGTFVSFSPALLPAFYRCFLPMLCCGLLIFVLHRFVGLGPPRIHNAWLWMALPSHVVFALTLFFLTLGVGERQHTIQQVLWHLSQMTAIAFPILYLFGGDRSEANKVQTEPDDPRFDSRARVRLLMLGEFAHIHQRQWVTSALSYRLHSVRSDVISFILVLPSYLIFFIFWLRQQVSRIERRSRWLLNHVVRASLAWLVFLSILFIVLFIYQALLTKQIPSQETWYLLVLSLPTFFTWALHVSQILYPHPESESKSTLTETASIQTQTKQASTETESTQGSSKQLFTAQARKEQKAPWHSVSLTVAFTLLVVFALLFYTSSHLSWNAFSHALLYFLLAFPWLTVRALRTPKEQQTLPTTTHRQSFLFPMPNDGVKAAPKARNVLLRFENLLKELEQWLQNKTYQLASGLGKTEKHTREQMLNVLVHLLSSTQQSLIHGAWYYEEERELERVYQEWIVHDIKPHAPQLLLEEYSELFTRTLDLLGSMLYDQTIPSRNVYLEDYPSRAKVLHALHQILELPLPTYPELQDTQRALSALMEFLLTTTTSTIQIPLTSEEQGLALSVLAALPSNKSLPFLESFYQKNSSYPLTPLFSLHPQTQIHESFAPKLPRNQVHKIRLINQLPTPLANAWKQLQKPQSCPPPTLPFLEKEWRLQVMKSAPQRIQQQQHSLQRQHQQNLHIQQWNHLKYAYFCALGYGLSCWKEYSASPTHLNLLWQNAEQRAETLQFLEKAEKSPLQQRLWQALAAVLSIPNDQLFDHPTPPQPSTTQHLHHQHDEAYLTLPQLPKEEWIAR